MPLFQSEEGKFLSTKKINPNNKFIESTQGKVHNVSLKILFSYQEMHRTLFKTTLNLLFTPKFLQGYLFNNV